MISDKPNTLEILEASGVLAEDVESTVDIYADQNIQKHFSAAFNRGAINLDAPEGENVAQPAYIRGRALKLLSACGLFLQRRQPRWSSSTPPNDIHGLPPRPCGTVG